MNTSSKVLFRQVQDTETSTYTYILGDRETKEALIIDSVIENTERDLKLIEELGLKLRYILETHLHADHITGAAELRKKTGAKIIVSDRYITDCADQSLNDGEILKCGSLELKALSTPGHTSNCMCLFISNDEMGPLVFTGDTLLIHGCGRTDFQEGSAETLFESIKKKLFTLPKETKVYPAHEYKGRKHSSIGDEITSNPRIGGNKTKEDFMQIMNNLNLARPKKMDIAVPANLKCGEVKST